MVDGDDRPTMSPGQEVLHAESGDGAQDDEDGAKGELEKKVRWRKKERLTVWRGKLAGPG